MSDFSICGTKWNTTGQWRFAPPTHVVVAFLEALKAHKGAVAERGARYAKIRDVMVAGMCQLGLKKC